MHAVLTGAAQLGVTSLPLEHRGLTVHWIGQAACVVALPDNDPLAAHEVVPVSALAGRRLITMANPYRLRRRLDAALAANAPAAGTIETNSSINALAAVRRPGRVGAGAGHRLRHAHAGRGDPFHRPGHTLFFGVITPQAQPPSSACLTAAATLAEAAAALLPGFVRHDACEHGALLQSVYGDDAPSLPDGPGDAAVAPAPARAADAPIRKHPAMTKPAAGLAALETRLRQDLSWLELPAKNWVTPRLEDGQPVLDVAIIGGGMAGLAASAALTHLGVNAPIFDQSPEGYEGPWATTARMETLRSPKQLTGPALACRR